MKSLGVSGGPKVHLLLEKIYPCDVDLDFIADLKEAAGAAADEPRSGRIEGEKVAIQRGNMNKPGHQKVGQLDEQAVVAHLENARREGLPFAAGRSLVLEILELLELHRVFFGIGGDAFGRREVFGDGAQCRGIRPSLCESEQLS